MPTTALGERVHLSDTVLIIYIFKTCFHIQRAAMFLELNISLAFLPKVAFDPPLRSMGISTSRHCTSCNTIYHAHPE